MGFFVFYRICTLFFEKLRFQLLFKTVRHKYDEDIRKCLEYVLSKCQMGDWFVLYQLSKNCDQSVPGASDLWEMGPFVETLEEAWAPSAGPSQRRARDSSTCSPRESLTTTDQRTTKEP